MKNIWNKMWEVMPIIWALIWLVIITFGSVTLLIVVFQWFLTAVGVI